MGSNVGASSIYIAMYIISVYLVGLKREMYVVKVKVVSGKYILLLWVFPISMPSAFLLRVLHRV